MLFSQTDSTENIKYRYQAKAQDPPLKYNEFTQTKDNDLKISANMLVFDLIKKKKKKSLFYNKN